MKMRYSGSAVMSCCCMVIAVGAVITAMDWPIRAALFPLAIAAAVFSLALGEFLFSSFGGKENLTSKPATMDFQASQEVDPGLAAHRTLVIFAWIFGFLFLILLFGFTIGIAIFIFSYVKLQAREGWGISLMLTALVTGMFYGLFVWLLDGQFHQGWIIEGLRALGIG